MGSKKILLSIDIKESYDMGLFIAINDSYAALGRYTRWNNRKKNQHSKFIHPFKKGDFNKNDDISKK